MKTTELMIGDWVTILRFRENGSDRNVRVNAIGQDCILAPGMFQDETGCDPYDEKKIAPIPLTAEILEKNERFIKVGANLWAMPYLGKWKLFVGIGNDTLVPNSEGVTVYVYYVHTLQHALRLCGLNELADNFKVK